MLNYMFILNFDPTTSNPNIAKFKSSVLKCYTTYLVPLPGANFLYEQISEAQKNGPMVIYTNFDQTQMKIVGRVVFLVKSEHTDERRRQRRAK